MKKWKRMLSLLLASIMVFSTFAPTAAFATESVMETTAPEIQESTESEQITLPAQETAADDLEMYAETASGTVGGGLQWSLDDAGTLTISGDGAMIDFLTGETGNPPWYAFENEITAVVIEEGVTSVGRAAFQWLFELTSVSLPDSLVSIGDFAFGDCAKLEGILIPKNVESIGDFAFIRNNSLEEIPVESGNANYTSSDGVLFNKSMTTLIAYPGGKTGDYTIPESVTEVAICAMSECEGLTGVYVPAGVTTLNQQPFVASANLKQITVSSQNPSYASQDGVLFDKSMKELIAYPTQKEGAYSIPEGVETLGSMAFTAANKLTSIFVPASVTDLTEDRFHLCSSLESITVSPDNTVYASQDGVLFNKALTTLLTYPDGRKGAYTIPQGTTAIERAAFGSCEYLTEVVFSEGITDIGYGAFQFCSGLKEVEIKKGLTTMGAVFECCENLQRITLPEGMTTIDNGAFWGCKGLKEIIIHKDMRNIRSFAFGDCQNLSDVYYSGSEAEWNALVPNIDSNNDPLLNATIHYNSEGEVISGTCGENLTWTLADGVLTISGAGEMDCGTVDTNPWADYRDSITSVVIEDGVTSIASHAFYFCSNLVSITIPESVAEIGFSAFYYCSSLTSITIPDGITTIETGTFQACRALETIVLPEGVTYIGAEAFYGCESLKSITVPKSVTSIEYRALLDCSSLTDIYYGGSEEDWGKISINTSNDGKLAMTTIHYAEESGESIISGTCGDALTWTLNEGTGALTISGLGTMSTYKDPRDIYAYGSDLAPWNGYAEQITSITIEANVTSVGDYAFASDNLTNLTTLTIPLSLKTIGKYAFRGATNLTDIYYAGTETEWASLIAKAGTGNNSLSKNTVTVHYNWGIREETAAGTCGDNLTWILDKVTGVLTISGTGDMDDYWGMPGEYQESPRYYPWYDEYNVIQAVMIEPGVTSIGSYAFANCYYLHIVSIPDTVTSIGHYAFKYCSKLTNITIPGSVTEMGSWVFDGCGITSAGPIGSGCDLEYGWETEIPAYAFHGITGLKKVMIPANMEVIREEAFTYCSSLTDVYYEGPEENWAKVLIDESNTYLLNAPNMHFIARTAYLGDVRYYVDWANAEQRVYFGRDGQVYSTVSGDTDSAFLEDPEALVNHFVTVETELVNGEEILLNMHPVSSYLGTVTAVNAPWITIKLGAGSEKTYAIPMDLADPESYADQRVLYHVYNGNIVGIEILETKRGRLTYVHAGSKMMKILPDAEASEEYYWLSPWADSSYDSYFSETGTMDKAIVYAADKNNFVYTMGPYSFRIISDGTNMSVQIGSKINLSIGIFAGDEQIEDVSGITFQVADSSILSVVSTEVKDNYRNVTLQTHNLGTTTLTLSDSNFGCVGAVRVTVYNDGRNSYTVSNVPQQRIEEDYFTNFYNVHGLYIDNYDYIVHNNQTTTVSFDVYNTQYIYGIVAVYDKDGNIYNAALINKMTDSNTSIKEGLFDNVGFLIRDIFQGDLLSYRQESGFSKQTSISVVVPEGGYLKICVDPSESFLVWLVNGVDILMQMASIAGAVEDFESNSTDFAGQLTAEMVLTKVHMELLKDGNKQSEKLMENVAKDVGYLTSERVGDFADTIAKNIEELNLGGIVAKTAMSFGYNVTEKTFTYFAGPAGVALNVIFTLGKTFNLMFQINDLIKAIGDIPLVIQNQQENFRSSQQIVVECEDKFPDDVALNVFKVTLDKKTLGKLEESNPQLHKEFTEGTNHTYNISLLKNGEETQPEGEVTVYIPVPEDMKHFASSGKAKVYRVEEDGDLTKMDMEVKDGFFVFTTDHFSLYAIVGYDDAEAQMTLGDADGNGRIQTNDAKLILQYCAEMVEDGALNLDVCDVDGNGRYQTNDAKLILQRCAEIIDAFPVEG